MSRLPNSNMVAVRASRFSETSPRRTQDYGRLASPNNRFHGHNNYVRRSPDVHRHTSRPSSYYGPSRDHNPRVQNFHSGIQENEKRDRTYRNNDFQHGDPSVLDRFNYTSNKTHLVSSGQEFGRNGNSGISNSQGFDDFNNSANFSVPVSFASGNHHVYQRAQGMRRLGDGSYSGN